MSDRPPKLDGIPPSIIVVLAFAAIGFVWTLESVASFLRRAIGF